MPRKIVRTKLRKVSAEGIVWDVVFRSVQARDGFPWTVRTIANFTGLSVGAVQGTFAWSVYLKAKREEHARNRSLAESKSQRKTS